MWLQSLSACLCESYRELDATLAAAGDAGDSQPGDAGESPDALIARMRDVADAFPPPPQRMLEMDLITRELCCPNSHASIVHRQGKPRQLLDRCRLPLCQAYLMLRGSTRKEILASVRSVTGDGITSDGSISITCIVSGIDRGCLTGGEDAGKPWRVVSRHMSNDCGLGWAVEALERAAAECGMPSGDQGGILSPGDVMEAMHTNWPRSMPSLVDAGEAEDWVVLAVHWMLVGIAGVLARGNAQRIASGANTPAQEMVAALSIQERVVAALPESDNSFSPFRGVGISLPLRDGKSVQIADMHDFNNWHSREHVPNGGRDFLFTRRIKCRVTCDTLESICESARLSLVSSAAQAHGWNPWGWERLTVEIGCSVPNARGGYGAKYLTTNSLCTRHVALEREAARRRAAELETQARWKLAYLRVLHWVFTVEAVVESIVEAYVRISTCEARAFLDRI